MTKQQLNRWNRSGVVSRSQPGRRPGLFAAALLAAALAWFGPPAQAGIIAYQSPAGLVGNQNFDGPLGMDFDVLCSPILVTQLGAFDSAQDGMKSEIRVYLFDRDNPGAPLAGPVAFNGTDGTLVGGSRFKPLEPPVVLPSGFHGCIVAEGYSAAEMLRNSFAPVINSTLDDGGGQIQFVGLSRYEWPVTYGVFPSTVDVGPVNRYHAGTFEFEKGPGPVVTTPPASHTVPDGSDTSLSVTATGAEPLSYQWQFNGVNLDGEVDSTLYLFTVSPSSAGNYRVVITDNDGGITCLAADLIVAMPDAVLAYDPATIITAGFDTGAPGIAEFFDVAEGTSVEVTELGTALALAQATLTNTITVQLYDVGSTTVLASVTFDETDSITPLASSPPLNLFMKPLTNTLPLGSGSYAIALYGASAGALYPRTWGGITLAGVTVDGAIRHRGCRYPTVAAPGILPEVPDGTGITYLAGTMRMLVTGKVVINRQPQGGVFAPGATTTLSVGAVGSQPITYKWYKDGVLITNATAAELTLTNLNSSQSGAYTVVAANEVGGVAATLTSAQAKILVANPPTTAIELHAAIVITGVVGLHYRVDYRTSLDPPDQWHLLQDIPSLPTSPYTVYDPTPATEPKRFYQTELLP